VRAALRAATLVSRTPKEVIRMMTHPQTDGFAGVHADFER
jgi:hypothetical protein